MRFLIETIHFSPKHIVFWLSVFGFITLIFLWPNGVAAQGEVTLTDPVTTSCTLSNPQASLTWATTLTGSPDYFVLRKLQGDVVYTQIAGPITDTFYGDNTIVSDQAYEYQIRAEKETDTFFSNEVAIAASYCKPELTLVAASCLADGPHINLGWSAISGNLLRYEVYRDGIKIAETTDTNFDDGSSIEAGVSYSYFVRAIWQDLTPADSDPAPQTALACPVTVSSSVQCTLTLTPGGPRVGLSWNSLLGVTSYQIYRQAQSETIFSLLNTVTATSTSYTDDFVDSLATYAQGGQASYFVKAIWPTDQSDSATVVEDILRCEPFLTVADNCDPTLIGFQLSWTATQGATKYNIWKDEAFLDQVDASFLFYPTDGGVDGTDPIATHKYKVVANTSPALSSNDVEASIDCTVTEPPSPVPVLEEPQPFCDTGDSQIQLDWSASDNVNYYKVYRTSIATTTVISVGGISYTDKGLQSGLEYIYYVLATGPGGETDPAAANTETVTAVSCTLPSTPDVTLSTQCTVGSPSVTVSWTSDDGNTLRYVIHRREDSEASFSVKATFDQSAPEFDTKTWIDTGGDVLTSTIYHYKVVAEGPIGVTPSESTVKSVSTLSCLPTTPLLSFAKSCLLGSAVVDLFWSTNEANTDSYEIFRLDFMGGTTPIHTIFDTSIKDWSDTSVAQTTLYDYKVEAVGLIGRSSEGYKSIETNSCVPPGVFTLSIDTVPFCQIQADASPGPYLSSQLSWTSAANANSYNITENRIDVPGSATYSDVATPFTDLGFGNALDFDGSNDYVVVPTSPSIDYQGTVISITGWMKRDASLSRDVPIVCKGSSTNQERYMLGLNNGTQINFRTTTVQNGHVRFQAGFVPPDQWVHLAGTYDGSTMTVYINGVVPSGGTRSQNGNLRSDSSNLHIGKRCAGDNRYYKGQLDEIRVYNRVLSAAEIQDQVKGIYNESGLLSSWYLDEGTGTVVSDSSNNLNNGTLTNMNPTTDWVSHGPQNLGDYNWQAEAFNTVGSRTAIPNSDPNFDPSVSRTAPMCEPPKPGLVLTPLCEPGVGPVVILQWSYSMNALAYEAYREEGAVDTLLATVSQTADASLRIVTDDNGGLGLAPLMSYSYYVAAKPIGAFPDLLSDTITVTTLDCALPTIPQNVQAFFECSGSFPQARITWEDSNSATSYTVWRDDSSDGSIDQVFTSVVADIDATFPNTTSYTFVDPLIAVDTPYTYFVTAVGPGGESAFSDSTNSSISAGNYCPPSTPFITSLTTECVSLAPVNTIFWSDDTPFNTQTYEIRRDGVPIKTITDGIDPEFATRTWEDNTGLAPLTSYTYTIKAIGPTALESTLSTPKSLDTWSCGIVPSTPSLSLDGLACSNNISTATVSWTGGTPASSYKVFRDNPDATTSIYSTRISPFTDRGGYALDFVDSLDQYVEVAHIPNYLMDSGSVELWFNVDDLNDDYGLFSKDSSGFDTGGHLSIWFRNSGDRVRVRLQSTSVSYTIDSGSITAGDWHHVVFTFGSHGMKLYVDGALANTHSYTGGLGPTSGGTGNFEPFTIGALTTGSGNLTVNPTNSEFEGKIDDVRFYNRELSLAEVPDHLAGIYNNESGLVGAWHFDDASGTIASDSSGFGNNGTLQNGPTWTRLSPTDSPFDADIFQAGQVYTYRVKAFGPDRESEFSNSVSTPPALDCSPAAPTIAVQDICTSSNNPVTLFHWNTTLNTSTYQLSKNASLLKILTPNMGGYIRDWLLIGSYPVTPQTIAEEENALKNIDYIDELNVRPRAGEGAGGEFWSEYSSSGDFIDFNSIFSPNDHTIAYAFAYVYSPIDQTVQLRIGSDDGVKVFLNGVPVWTNYVYRGAAPDQDIFNVDLTTGFNTLIIKVLERHGGWGFYARFTDAGGNPVLGDFSAWDSSVTTAVSADYYVIASNLGGDSASNTVSSAPLDCLPAKPIVNLSQQCSAGDPRLVLEWDGDSNTDYWSVYKRRVLDQPLFSFLINTTATSTIDSDVQDGLIYEYYVDAIGGGVSTSSDAISQEALVCADPPSTPVIDSALPVCFGSSSRIQIDWGGYTIEDTLSFEVLRKNLTGGEVSFSARVTELSPSTTQYADFVDKENDYVYKIRGIGAGASNFADSTESATTTGLDCSSTPPNPSTLFLETVVSTGDVIAVSVRWTDAGNEQDIGGYRLFRSSGGPFVDISADLGFSDGFPGNIVPTDVFQVDNTVVDNQTYTYRVYAYNAFAPYDPLNPLDGGIASNDIVVVVPIAKPGDFILSGVPIAGDISLKWKAAATTAAGGVVEYTVYRSDTAAFSTQPVVGCENLSTLDCDDTSANSSEPYYRATATNLGGSTNSNVVQLFNIFNPRWREITPF